MSYLSIENLIKYNLVGTGEGRTAPCSLTELSGVSPLMYDLLKQTTHIPYADLRECMALWEGGCIINGMRPHELFLRQPIFIGSFSPFIQDSLKTGFSQNISYIMNPSTPFHPSAPVLQSGFEIAVLMRELFERERGNNELTFGLILPDNIRYSAGEHAIIEVPIVDEILRANIWIPPCKNTLRRSEIHKEDRHGIKRSYWPFAAVVRPLCSSRIHTSYQTISTELPNTP